MTSWHCFVISFVGSVVINSFTLLLAFLVVNVTSYFAWWRFLPVLSACFLNWLLLGFGRSHGAFNDVCVSFGCLWEYSRRQTKLRYHQRRRTKPGGTSSDQASRGWRQLSKWNFRQNSYFASQMKDLSTKQNASPLSLYRLVCKCILDWFTSISFTIL